MHRIQPLGKLNQTFACLDENQTRDILDLRQKIILTKKSLLIILSDFFFSKYSLKYQRELQKTTVLFNLGVSKGNSFTCPLVYIIYWKKVLKGFGVRKNTRKISDYCSRGADLTGNFEKQGKEWISAETDSWNKSLLCIILISIKGICVKDSLTYP